MSELWQIGVGIVVSLLAVWLALVVSLFLAARRLSIDETIRLLPDTIRLLRSLATDPEVPRGARVRLWLLFGYLAMPIDLVPDFLPVIGYADDAILVCLVLRSVIRRAGPEAIRRNWPGTEQGLAALWNAGGLPEEKEGRFMAAGGDEQEVLGKLRFETAVEHVCRDVPTFHPRQSVEEARLVLSDRRFDLVSHCAVCEHGKLEGILRIEDLLPAPGQTSVRDLMDAEPPVVAPGLDQEKVAWRAVKHGESALAVVDSSGRFVGFIPPQRLLEVLLWEHDEDISRLGGVLHRQTVARASQDETTARRLWHRLPWLFVGLAGALGAAEIVQTFEGQLEHGLLLTMFLPGIIYLADAVGTQTETLVVRGLSLGLDFRRMLKKEIWTGFGIGLVLAASFFLAARAIWPDTRTIGAVALALFAASGVASAVAMVLPWLFDRFDIDPAFGSGPLATVIQDLLSIVIYFLVARSILG